MNRGPQGAVSQLDFFQKAGLYVIRQAPPGKPAPEQFGFRRMEKLGLWATSVPTYASRAVQHYPPTTAAQEALAEAEETFRLSTAADAPSAPPAPEGLEYLPFQRAGINFAIRRDRVLIADEMGLGKTVQVLGLINHDPTLRHILVLCPLTLKANWLSEAERWLVRPIKKAVVGGVWPHDAEFVLLNYERVQKWHDEVRQIKWDLMILDEAHYLKNSNAKRSVAVFGGTYKSKKISPIKSRKIVMLTGTPMKNRPDDLWALVHNLSRFHWPESISEFRRRYGAACKGISDDDIAFIDRGGNQVLDELAHRLRSTVMIRRQKKQVLIELPEKFRQMVSLEPEKHIVPDLRFELEVYQKWCDAKKRLKEMEKIPQKNRDEVFSENVKLLSYEARELFNNLSKIRKRTALLKIPYCVQHIRAALQEKSKVVIFAHHLQVVSVLNYAFPYAVSVTGNDNERTRQEKINKFINQDVCRVFIGSILSTGTGLTLTVSDMVVFVELDWSPANMQQAEDRCHRIGQNNNVLIQHIVLNESLDAHISKMLIEKQAVIDRVLNH